MRNLEIKNNDCHAALAMTKSVQSGRSLLPESGADAPTVLSAVYTDSTPAKNRQADVPQYGRSMIEMLGVLAIIGVLSVGGIAGYSKAMQKYRINKTIEQITLIAGNVRVFFAPQKSYTGLTKAVIKKAKLVPDEMWDSNKIKNIWGGEIYVQSFAAYRTGSNYDDCNESGFGKTRSFEIYIGSSPESIPPEACIELLTQDWKSQSAGFLGINVGITYAADKTWCPSATSFNVPIPLDEAVNLCSLEKGYFRPISFVFE